MGTRLVVVFVFANFWLDASLAVSPYSPAITTTSGVIQGQLIQAGEEDNGLDVFQFLGIPYAEPPMGDRRFRRPVPKATSPGVLMASKEPFACPQMFSSIFPTRASDIFMPVQEISEDCLYLNIWAPRAALDRLYTSKQMRGTLYPWSAIFNTTLSPLAVMVFIHGGGFYSGSAMLPMYNGSVLAAYNNVVVVSIQYRLGALGFAYMGTEDVPGNMGLWDQLEALKWIKSNIGAFGGNPDRTTIFGEGSGAVSVGYHLLSPNSTGYFQRAIMQSGSANEPAFWLTAEEALKRSNALAEAVYNASCAPDPSKPPAKPNAPPTTDKMDRLECLRRVNAADILRLQDTILKPDSLGSFGLMQVAFVPVVDNDFLPWNPEELVNEGEIAKDVSVLMGSNLNESSLFMLFSAKAIFTFPSPLNPDRPTAGLNATDFSNFLREYFAFYPRNDQLTDPMLMRFIEMQYATKCDNELVGTGVLKALGEATADYSIVCPLVQWARIQSKSSKVFMYQFTHRPSTEIWPKWMGVVHGDELPFVFGFPFTWLGHMGIRYTVTEKMLSRKVMTYWTNFAKFGDPNSFDAGSPNGRLLPMVSWPMFDAAKKVVLELNAASTVDVNAWIRDFKTSDCLFWNEFLPSLVKLINAAKGISTPAPRTTTTPSTNGTTTTWWEDD